MTATATTNGNRLAFVVHGRPITQGSKTRTRYGMRESNALLLAPWREAVKYAALRCRPEGWPTVNAYAVAVTFSLPRPIAQPKRKRLFPTHARGSDIDKLCRAVLDALTDAGVWINDAQVVTLFARKRFINDPSPDVMTLPGVAIDIACIDA